MAKLNSILTEEDKFDLTPMIDVVFLLIIYFMVTVDLTEEADLGLRLPANTMPSADVQLPEEHIVEVLASGEVLLNGAPMDNPDSRNMPELTRTLERLKSAADRAGQKTAVVIYANGNSLHQRSIDVLNACASARIRFVSFAPED